MGALLSRSACVLICVAGACHAPLHLPNADALGPLASGGPDVPDDIRFTVAGDAGARPGSIPGLPAGSVRICTYVASGQDLAVRVFRDQARTSYTLVSRLFASPIIQSIGVDSDKLFAHEIEYNHTLFARALSNGLLRFTDQRLDSSGPGWSFSSSCSVDGIQIRQEPRDPLLRLELIRPDDTSYRVDLSEWWTVGSYPIRFYATGESSSTIELGTTTEMVSRTPSGAANLAFTDLDGRRVSIDITSYGVLTEIRILSQE